MCSGLRVCCFNKIDIYAERLSTLLHCTVVLLFDNLYFNLCLAFRVRKILFCCPCGTLCCIENLCVTEAFLISCVCVLYPSSQPTSPTTPNKPLAPLDWASGVTTKPDPSVVNKHIRKVVDVSRQPPF